MQYLIIKSEIRALINALAKELLISEDEVIKIAVTEYAQKYRSTKDILSYAGILNNDEADEMLYNINNSRIDK
ncbi:MAG: hypothetical protein GF353_24575 [Candidatus Lokiarchaeota archaeon]|nr:hypothetical protein [Candidatus Lokiarchaeota archaeon]